MKTKPCERCGNDIPWFTPLGTKVVPSSYKKKRFCSTECFHEAMRAGKINRPARASDEDYVPFKEMARRAWI